MRKVVVFDLDDTLFKEIEYLKTAYSNIAHELWDDEWHVHYIQMLADYYAGVNVFEKICRQRLDVEMRGLLNMYRYGVHQLTLENDVSYTLSQLRNEGVILGIVSDGIEVTQLNKIKALGLTRWIDEDYIVINSDPQHYKPDSFGYKCLKDVVATKTGGIELEYTYVGDNPTKDFICPNALGWNTVCLKDDGRNIHEQNFESTNCNALPNNIINSLRELCGDAIQNHDSPRI